MRDGIELHVEVIRFEKKVFTVLAAVQGNPFGGTFGERNFFCCVAGEVETGDERVFEARAERGVCAMKVAAGKIFFIRSGADGDAVDFDGGAGRIAGDGEFFGRHTGGKEQKERAERKRVEAHGDDPSGVYYRRS